MNTLTRLLFIAPLLLTALASAEAEPVETSVEAAGPAGSLKGIMLAPGSAPGPLALIIPGSGPTDSDGNNPLGVRASTYKLLAHDLAARGVATVRIDKRECSQARQQLRTPMRLRSPTTSWTCMPG